MYATAHRVWSRSTGQRGINAFLHRHDKPEDFVDWSQPDVLEIVTQTIPGRLVNDSIQVAPGGNEVQSHLDVAGPDGTPLLDIQKALSVAATKLPTSTPFKANYGLIGVSFGCQISYLGKAQVEFAALAEAIERVITATPEPRTQGVPIRILVSDKNGVLVCRLASNELKRVKTIGGYPDELELVPQVGAAHGVIQDFERLYGDITPELVYALTGLSKDQLLAVGGFQFVDQKTNQILRTWPQPRA